MSADILLFVPRANPKADRAFWVGTEPDPVEVMAQEIIDQVEIDKSLPDDCA